MDILTQLRSSLSEYRIEREIGAGGMATVYLARDLRHDRPVAVKVLNPELGAVLGVERFLSEIKVTANLQHPNLLPLFDSGEAGGLLYYVMPFVEGETLRNKLEREKQLPIDEAVRIAVAVANALDYAHAHDVVHRDLKPENILLQAGQPVVADFGIALAVSKAGGNRITQTGLSLGTPEYMSPEQAAGDRVTDRRSDIYSLGAMTYEMLTGEPPHTGSTAQAIIARLLTDKPRSIRASRSSVPEHVEAAVEHALEKLPADRFSAAREFAEALQGRGAPLLRTTTHSAAAVARRGWRQRLRDPVDVGLAAVAVIALVGVATLRRTTTVGDVVPPLRFALSTPDSLRPFDNYPWPATISPRGDVLVYATNRGGIVRLFALRTDQLEARPIPGTEGAFQPLFSPDGQWVAFEQGSKEKKVRLDGSAPITIAEGAGANGADWSSADELIVGATGPAYGLSKVSTAGGELAQFTHPDSSQGERQHVWPIATPDGKHVVFTIWSGTQATSRLAIATIDGGSVTRLDIKGIRPLAVLDDHLVYVQADGAVMAVAIDVGRGKVLGKPVPVHDPVTVITGLNGNSGIFVSPGGALVTSRGGARSRLSWIGTDGRTAPIIGENRSYGSPRLSPDGRRLAVLVSDGGNTDIWLYELTNGTFSRITNMGTVSSVQWTPDGDLVYAAAGDLDRSAVYRQSAGGGSPPRKLFEQGELTPTGLLAPDGRSLLLSSYHQTSWDQFRVVLDSGSAVRPYLDSRSNEMSPQFSPDGKWVALMSDESGQMEISVRSYPDPSSRLQISVNGGVDAVWSPDGSRLFYRAGTALLAARLTRSPALQVVSRDTVVAKLSIPGGFVASYDVARDGRLAGLISDRDDFQLVVSPNWRTELRQRFATTKK